MTKNIKNNSSDSMNKYKKFDKLSLHKRRRNQVANTKDRIAKRLSMLGVASRREAEKMILEGKIKINGILCKELTQLVSYEDKIVVNGKEIANKPIRTQIFMMNKPAGYVTSNNDPQGRRTIFELIPNKFGHLIAIGRLDYNTEGLLLLTNNGELSRLMELPATGLKRVYYARVIGEINDNVIKKLENLKNGIKIEGTEYGKMIVEVQDYNQTRATLRIVIFEGKNNEIRRIMWHLGLKVVKLTRVQYGDFRLKDLPEGCLRESHFKVDIRELEKKASKNIKKYHEMHGKINEQQTNEESTNDNSDNDNIDDASMDNQEFNDRKIAEKQETNVSNAENVDTNEQIVAPEMTLSNDNANADLPVGEGEKQ